MIKVLHNGSLIIYSLVHINLILTIYIYLFTYTFFNIVNTEYLPYIKQYASQWRYNASQNKGDSAKEIYSLWLAGQINKK